MTSLWSRLTNWVYWSIYKTYFEKEYGPEQAPCYRGGPLCVCEEPEECVYRRVDYYFYVAWRDRAIELGDTYEAWTQSWAENIALRDPRAASVSGEEAV